RGPDKEMMQPHEASAADLPLAQSQSGKDRGDRADGCENGQPVTDRVVVTSPRRSMPKQREDVEKRCDKDQRNWKMSQAAVGAFPEKRVHGSCESSLSISGERAVHDGEGMIPLQIMDVGDS